MLSKVYLSMVLGLTSFAFAVSAQTPSGYLGGHEPSTVDAVPPAPAPGSPLDLADRAIFKQTRVLENTPRWSLARSDAEISVADLLRVLSCGTSVELTEAKAPVLASIVRKLVPDMLSAYNQPKDLYKRPRPFLRDDGNICVARSDVLVKTYDYPSGHATFAWTVGLILAELAPDRAGPVLARARAFGESRAVCGVHSASAVSEARTAGSTLVAALHGDATFRADMDRARVELAALRIAAPIKPIGACDSERALVREPLW